MKLTAKADDLVNTAIRAALAHEEGMRDSTMISRDLFQLARRRHDAEDELRSYIENLEARTA